MAVSLLPPGSLAAANPIAPAPQRQADQQAPTPPQKRVDPGLAKLLCQLSLAAGLLLLSACERQPSPEARRIEELNLKIQQLEQRLNTLARERNDAADRKGKPPAGVIKSLTIRTGSEDDRLRIYWADGTTTDLPCTKEQSTFACG
jgi:hypothetical protein